MAKDKKSKKDISANSKKKVVVKTASSSTSMQDMMPKAKRGAVAQELLFGKQNYMFIAAAFGLILLGMLLMMGGDMPDSNTWDESLIYSTRRTLIAPIVILIGLIVGVVAIFRD